MSMTSLTFVDRVRLLDLRQQVGLGGVAALLGGELGHRLAGVLVDRQVERLGWCRPPRRRRRPSAGARSPASGSAPSARLIVIALSIAVTMPFFGAAASRLAAALQHEERAATAAEQDDRGHDDHQHLLGLLRRLGRSFLLVCHRDSSRSVGGRAGGGAVGGWSVVVSALPCRPAEPPWRSPRPGPWSGRCAAWRRRRPRPAAAPPGRPGAWSGRRRPPGGSW